MGQLGKGLHTASLRSDPLPSQQVNKGVLQQNKGENQQRGKGEIQEMAKSRREGK